MRRSDIRCVRVWFGAETIATYLADADAADRFIVAIGMRFRGLTVTSEPWPEEDCSDQDVRPLPDPWLWQLMPS